MTGRDGGTAATVREGLGALTRVLFQPVGREVEARHRALEILVSEIEARYPQLPAPRPVLSASAQETCPGLDSYREIQAPFGSLQPLLEDLDERESSGRRTLELGGNRFRVQVQSAPQVGLPDESRDCPTCDRFLSRKCGPKAENVALPELHHQRERIEPPAPSFHSLQFHLGPPSRSRFGGVHASVAWGLPGGRGAGVTVADVELGWDDHVDLQRPDGCIGHDYAGVADGDRAHGVAVEGIIHAQNDGHGVDGLVSRARFARYGVPDFSPANVTNALVHAIADLCKGDVILLETQFRLRFLDGKGGRCCSPLLPYEASDDAHAAIACAHAKGIHVVMAAGNGSSDLCDFLPGKRDSGALVVASGQPAYGERTSHTNYGRRIDLFSSGEWVPAPGLHRDGQVLWSPGEPSTSYQLFAGTSAAAAIVAGVVASLSAIVQQAGHHLSPAEMRTLLVETGYTKKRTDRAEIGVHPDLRQACLQLERTGRLPEGSVL